MTTPFVLKPGRIPLRTLRELWSSDRQIALDSDCRSHLSASERVVASKIDAGETIYGVNTGFGSLATTAIDTSQLQAHQRAVVLACTAGDWSDVR